MAISDEILGFGMAVGPGDRFILLDKLGEGGMGEVWRASDQELCEDGKPQVVALKFLSRALRNDPQSLAFLRTEVLRSQRLSHPNIVRIFDLHMHKGMPFIKMEYVEGNSLRRWLDLEPAGLMPWEMVVELMAQLVNALEYAHRTEKIVHRDLKPGNLLLSAGNVLKLSDFGISGEIREAAAVGQGKGLAGTLAYASPQQIAGERPAPEDDIYALGSTLYELLTGSVPFYADSWQELVRKITYEPPLSIPERLQALGRQNEVPPKLLILVQRCLAKDPLERPKTHEIAHRLPALGGSIVPPADRSAYVPQSQSQWVEPAAPPHRVRPWLTFLFIAALAALAWWQRDWIQVTLRRIHPAPPSIAADTRPTIADKSKGGSTADEAKSPGPGTGGPGSVVKPTEQPELKGAVVISVTHFPPAEPPFHFQILDTNRQVVVDLQTTNRNAKFQTSAIPLTKARYSVIGRDKLFWELRKEVSVESDQTTNLALVFKGGPFTVDTDPSDLGATVAWLPGEAVDRSFAHETAGFAPRDFRAGWVHFTVYKRCYFTTGTNYEFDPLRSTGPNARLVVKLRRTKAPLDLRPNDRWTNSLGMIFQRINSTSHTLACITETRVGEFRKFVAGKPYDASVGMYAFTADGRVQGKGNYSWENPGPGFKQTDEHPVVGVSCIDATNFCNWLTGLERDHTNRYLEEDMFYRLPTTNEWLELAGGKEYPWGDDAAAVVGNYAGTEVTNSDWPPCWPVLRNHTDLYPRTAPALLDEFKNTSGFYHVGGNAAEWCLTGTNAVLCGGSWFDGEWEQEHPNPGAPRTAATRPEEPELRDARNGFRVVLLDPGEKNQP